MKTTVRRRSITLTKDDVKMLRELCAKMGDTETNIIKIAVREFYFKNKVREFDFKNEK